MKASAYAACVQRQQQHAADLAARYGNVIVSSNTVAQAIVNRLHAETSGRYTYVRYGLGWKVVKDDATV